MTLTLKKLLLFYLSSAREPHVALELQVAERCKSVL